MSPRKEYYAHAVGEGIHQIKEAARRLGESMKGRPAALRPIVGDSPGRNQSNAHKRFNIAGVPERRRFFW